MNDRDHAAAVAITAQNTNGSKQDEPPKRLETDNDLSNEFYRLKKVQENAANDFNKKFDAFLNTPACLNLIGFAICFLENNDQLTAEQKQDPVTAIMGSEEWRKLNTDPDYRPLLESRAEAIRAHFEAAMFSKNLPSGVHKYHALENFARTHINAAIQKTAEKMVEGYEFSAPENQD